MDQTSKNLLILRPGTGEGALCFPAGAIVVYHDTTLIDAGIRLGSGSYFTHCGIARGDGTTYCAMDGHGVWTGFGDEAQGTIHVEARMPPAGIDVQKLLTDAKNMVGTPYDILGWPADPLGNILHWFARYIFPGGAPHSVHCSEYIAWLLSLQGVKWKKPFRAITPQDIANYIGA